MSMLLLVVALPLTAAASTASHKTQEQQKMVEIFFSFKIFSEFSPLNDSFVKRQTVLDA